MHSVDKPVTHPCSSPTRAATICKTQARAHHSGPCSEVLNISAILAAPLLPYTCLIMSSVVRIVLWSVRHRISVIALSLVVAIWSANYVAHHFQINTDTSRLLTVDKRWDALSTALDHAFPQRGGSILVLVEADAPEFADRAASELAVALKKDKSQFTTVTQPEGGPFFEHNGLLFLPLLSLF